MCRIMMLKSLLAGRVLVAEDLPTPFFPALSKSSAECNKICLGVMTLQTVAASCLIVVVTPLAME